MDGDRGVGRQVTHPARLGRPTEAQRAVDPDTIDGPRVRPRVRTNGRDPVIRRRPNALLDPAPGYEVVRSSRCAVRSGKADGADGRRFPRHDPREAWCWIQ